MKTVWYDDYIRTTGDTKFVLHHFLRDFLTQHRLRYIIYFRIAQNTKNKMIKFLCEVQLFLMCRKYGIEVKTPTQIGPGFVMGHPYNITISPYARLGKNVNIMKGATIGIAAGKRKGTPVIGNNVYIGINSTVVGGITIGNDVMIAPNSFVNVDVPSHSVVIGNPCIIKHKDNATEEYLAYPI